MFYLNLSKQSLFTNFRQYVSLFLVTLFGSFIILFTTYVSDGMLKSVKEKALLYYGGEIQFIGGDSLAFYDFENRVEMVKPYFPKDVTYIERINHDGNHTYLYYEGAYSKVRCIQGIDFTNPTEKNNFDSFNYAQGNSDYTEGSHILLISEQIAQKLGVSAGDIITIQTNDTKGSINTLNFTVQGIFIDSSMFGKYTAYADIESLRQLGAYAPGYDNRFAISYNDRSPSKKEIVKLQESLSQKYNMYPLTDNKRAFYDVLEKDNSQKPIYALITLDANIKDLGMITRAIKLIVLLITVILVAIIAIGIASTYRVIILKRTVEIGTYRALGMKTNGVRMVFITEILLLLFTGFICGIVLALISSKIISLFNFAFIPAFDVFLKEGHLAPVYSLWNTLKYLFVIIVTTILIVLFTIQKLIRLSPVKALATTN